MSNTQKKPQYKSKTNWLGAVVAGFGAAQALLPELKNILDPSTYGWTLFAIGVTVVVLRQLTTQPVR